MIVRRSLVLLTLALFCGCSVPKDVANLKPDSMPSLALSESRALSGKDFVLGDWPSQGWWEMFHDPQLNACIVKALRESPTLKKAEAHVKQAHQVTKSRRSIFYPNLDATAQTSWNYLAKDSFFRSVDPIIPPTYDETTVGFAFNYEFDFWGKYRKIFESALGRERASRADAAQAALILSISVAEAYFDMQTHLAKMEILKETLEDRRALLDLRHLRRENGLDNDIQTNNAQEELYSIEKTIVQTQERIDTDKHLLKMLMGEGPDASLSIEYSESIFDGPFILPAEISLNLVARRPDLMAQIWRVEAAAQEIGAAKREFYPNVNLSAFGGFDSVQYKNLFTWANKTGTLLPAIDLPIFTGGRLQANLGMKAYAFAEALEEYNELVLRAAKEVADEITILHKVNERVRIQAGIVKSKSLTFDLTQDRCLQGLNTFLSVLRAEEEVLKQKLNAVDLDYLRLITTLRLIRALGGGYKTPGEIPTPSGG